jgi:hypothetical protein
LHEAQQRMQFMDYNYLTYHNLRFQQLNCNYISQSTTPSHMLVRFIPFGFHSTKFIVCLSWFITLCPFIYPSLTMQCKKFLSKERVNIQVPRVSKVVGPIESGWVVQSNRETDESKEKQLIGNWLLSWITNNAKNQQRKVYTLLKFVMHSLGWFDQAGKVRWNSQFISLKMANVLAVYNPGSLGPCHVAFTTWKIL